MSHLNCIYRGSCIIPGAWWRESESECALELQHTEKIR